MISVGEFLDLIIMTGALGYIFMDTFKSPNKDPFHISKGFNWSDFWYSVTVVAPSIILHEMAHKFSALLLGMEATFHAAYQWLMLGVVLKLLNFGFIFFVPGYVSIMGRGSHWEFALIAFMGPLVHLVLWLGSKQYLRSNPKNARIWVLVMEINKFLFILNMLPIPGFDGFSVYKHLFQAIF